MPENELRDHYERRAREERDRAAACESASAAQDHLRLAEEYERKAQASQLIQCGTARPE
jgi:hypothetical protein